MLWVDFEFMALLSTEQTWIKSYNGELAALTIMLMGIWRMYSSIFQLFLLACLLLVAFHFHIYSSLLNVIICSHIFYLSQL